MPPRVQGDRDKVVERDRKGLRKTRFGLDLHREAFGWDGEIWRWLGGLLWKCTTSLGNKWRGRWQWTWEALKEAGLVILSSWRGNFTKITWHTNVPKYRGVVVKGASVGAAGSREPAGVQPGKAVWGHPLPPAETQDCDYPGTLPRKGQGLEIRMLCVLLLLVFQYFLELWSCGGCFSWYFLREKNLEGKKYPQTGLSPSFIISWLGILGDYIITHVWIRFWYCFCRLWIIFWSRIFSSHLLSVALRSEPTASLMVKERAIVPHRVQQACRDLFYYYQSVRCTARNQGQCLFLHGQNQNSKDIL